MTSTAPALPDQPPAAPKSFDIVSKSGRFTAHLAWPGKVMTVYATDSGHKKQLWHVPGWSPVAFLSDIGPTLAVGHPDNNLLPANATQNTIVLTFYRDGAKLRDVQLGDVIAQKALHEANGRLAWGVHYGFDAQGHYLIEAQDGRVVTLDPANK